MTLPSDDIDVPGISLTPEGGVGLRQTRGRAVREAVEPVMNRSNYRYWPDVVRAKNLEAAIVNARRRATEQAKRDLRRVAR